MKCENCERNQRAEFEFGDKQICRICYEEIGEGFDDLEIRMIAKRRGEKWIKDILERIYDPPKKEN